MNLDPHELINLIQHRLRVRVEWTCITNDFVEFRYATKIYSVAGKDGDVKVLEATGDAEYEDNLYSKYIEGVLNGGKRDDSGRLLPC